MSFLYPLVLLLLVIPFALLVWIWSEHNTFFRRFGMQDAYTVALNAALLFVVLLYVYPLKFMFDRLFAGLLHRGDTGPHQRRAAGVAAEPYARLG